MPEHLITVEGLVKDFGKVRAVDRLDFTVERGEIFALLGPNGAGKSTTVRILIGILRPDAGTVRYHLGDSSTRLAPSRLGYLPEDRGLYPEVPVIRTLTYMGTLRGMSRRAAEGAAREWLERLDLAERAGDKLDSLSKGNQQKVQLIGAMLHRPALAVLDEPFSGLDPLNQDRFLDILRELKSSGTTILLSAHQMQLVERIADRVLLLSRGRQVLGGTIDDVKAEARTSAKIFLKLADEAATSSLANLPAVARVERRPDGELAVELEGSEALSGFLGAVTSRHQIRSIRSEEIGLHEIFVRRVSDDLGAHDRAGQPAEVGS